MKEQYVGDINDYRKYALLRALAVGGRTKIGVCWMLTPPDGRSDGNQVEYQSQPDKWRHFDPGLFDLLKSAVDEPDNRRLRVIEESGAIPGATYFNEMLQDDADRRRAYFDRAMEHLADCDLIFFDPDNGLEIPSKPKGHSGSSRYLYGDEVSRAYDQGRSLLIYQHFAREKRDPFIQRKANELAAHAIGASIWAFQTSNVVFLLAARPEHVAKLEDAIGSVSDRLGSLIRKREVLLTEASVPTPVQREPKAAKPRRRKRKKHKKREEHVHYEIRISGWDYYYSLRLSDPKSAFDRGTYSEIATFSLKGELISPEDLPYTEGLLTLSAQVGMLNQEYVEQPKAIGGLSVAGDTLTAYVFVPAERLSELATVAASGRLQAARFIGSRLRYRSGTVHNISVTTEFEEEEG